MTVDLAHLLRRYKCISVVGLLASVVRCQFPLDSEDTDCSQIHVSSSDLFTYPISWFFPSLGSFSHSQSQQNCEQWTRGNLSAELGIWCLLIHFVLVSEYWSWCSELGTPGALILVCVAWGIALTSASVVAGPFLVSLIMIARRPQQRLSGNSIKTKFITQGFWGGSCHVQGHIERLQVERVRAWSWDLAFIRV